MLDHSGAQPWKMKGKYLLVVLFGNLVPGPLAGQDPALLSQACDAGDMQSCDDLGLQYEAGLGVTRDLTRAVTLFQSACDGELMLGCNHLAGMYRTGAGVAQDLTAAANLYEQACDGGMMEACANLGISYERGDGVALDVATAVGLYQRACEAGVTWTCNRLEIANGPAPGVASASVFRIATLIVDTETSDPLGEAIVQLPRLGIRVVTDGSGRAEFAELPTGRHPIVVERAGYQVMEGYLLAPGVPEVTVPLERITLIDVQARGRVIGRVLEGGREYGVSDVDVTALTSPPISTLSDPQGRFSFNDMEPGLVEVQFQRLGYAARTTTVIVQPGGTVEIVASMSAQPIELEPIAVVVRSRRLERNGFYERGHLGDQLTRSEIVELSPIVVSSLFRGLFRTSVTIRQRLDGTPYLTGRRDCELRIYLDDFPMDDWDFDTISPDWLEGMEVYQGMFVPPQYFPDCGVLLLWTKL